MRVIQLAVSASLAIAACLGSMPSFAQSTTAAQNIERFAIAKPAATTAAATSIERTATLDGTQYAVIAPIFTDTAGNYSFIRLQNLISTPSTFTVTVVGSPSANIYGTGTIVIPAGASVQKSIDDILAAAKAGALANGDTAYAVYLSNPDLSAYQHVVYSYVSKFFENASVCQTSLSQSAVRYLPSVHTKTVADLGYPSKIFIHNYYTAAVTYNVSVYDAVTGSLIGTVPVATQPNSTYALDFSYFETQLHWTPTSSQGQANLIFTPQTAITGVTLPPVTVSHFIYNQAFQAYVNMSETCAVNAGSASTGAAATAAKTTYSGTVAGVNIAGSAPISGTLSVSIPTGSASASASLASTSSVEKSQATATATGTLVIGGNTISLTGTYDTTTKAVSLTGGGFTFSGTISSGAFTGSYTGPGAAKGSFSAISTANTLVTAYCGTFRANGPNPNTGTFNFQISVNGTLTGTYSGTDGSGTLTGAATGSSFTAKSAASNATGTISGTSISGTYKDIDDPTSGGSFSGSKCALPAAS